MLKERIGGTCGVVEKREAACRMVPSPPRVVMRSTLVWRGEGECGVGVGGGVVKMGKAREAWIVEATWGSRIRERLG